MSQNETLHLAQKFLGRMGSGAEPTEIAKLFSETLEWEIAGDTGALPWIGHKSGRAAITDFVRDSRAMIERISFEVHDILASDKRAVILGSLASKLKRTGKIVTTDFAIILLHPMVRSSVSRCWKTALLSPKRHVTDSP